MVYFTSHLNTDIFGPSTVEKNWLKNWKTLAYLLAFASTVCITDSRPDSRAHHCDHAVTSFQLCPSMTHFDWLLMLMTRVSLMVVPCLT